MTKHISNIRFTSRTGRVLHLENNFPKVDTAHKDFLRIKNEGILRIDWRYDKKDYYFRSPRYSSDGYQLGMLPMLTPTFDFFIIITIDPSNNVNLPHNALVIDKKGEFYCRLDCPDTRKYYSFLNFKWMGDGSSDKMLVELSCHDRHLECISMKLPSFEFSSKVEYRYFL